MYIKAFDKNFKIGSKKFNIGEIYNKKDNNFSKEFEIFDSLEKSLYYYPSNARYFEVKPLKEVYEVKPYYSHKCTNEYVIVRELSIEDLVELDTTGEWILHYAITLLDNVKNHRDWLDFYISYYSQYYEEITYEEECNMENLYNVKDKNINLKYLEENLLKKENLDSSIYFLFPYYIENCNIKEFQEKVLQTDTKGDYIYEFASIEGSDLRLLEDKLLEIDKVGENLYNFSMRYEKANISKIQDKILNIDKTGEFIYKFWNNIINSDKKLLEERLLEVDKTGKWIFRFILNNSEIQNNISLINKYRDKLIEVDKKGIYRTRFADELKSWVRLIDYDLKESIELLTKNIDK